MKKIITNNIIQRPIDFHSWKMIASSKGYCKTISQDDNYRPIDVVREYITKEASLLKEISDKDLYYWLIDVILDVCNETQLNNILKIDLKDLLDKNLFEKKEVNYTSVCEMLVTKLYSLKVRESKDSEITDLFIIFDEDGKGMSIDEANEKWLNKDKTLTK